MGFNSGFKGLNVASEVTMFGGYKYGMLPDPVDIAQSTRQRQSTGLPQRIRWSATRNHKPRVVYDICYQPLVSNDCRQQATERCEG